MGAFFSSRPALRARARSSRLRRRRRFLARALIFGQRTGILYPFTILYFFPGSSFSKGPPFPSFADPFAGPFFSAGCGERRADLSFSTESLAAFDVASWARRAAARRRAARLRTVRSEAGVGGTAYTSRPENRLPLDEIEDIVVTRTRRWCLSSAARKARKATKREPSYEISQNGPVLLGCRSPGIQSLPKKY